MSKWKKWIRLAAYLGIGGLSIYIAIGLIRSGNWWAIPFLIIGYGILIILTEVFLLLYRILTTNFSFVIKRDMENAWVLDLSLGRIIFSGLLLMLKKWRGVAEIGKVTAAWMSVKNGTSLRVIDKQQNTKDIKSITGTIDKKIAIRRVGKT